MHATLLTLVRENILTKEQMNEFSKDHFCLMVHPDSGLSAWFKQHFGKDSKNPVVTCVRSNV
jgi:hypothetical protein